MSENHPQEIKDLETEVKAIKKEIGDETMYKRLEGAFKILAEPRKRPTKYMSLYYMTEKSLRENFSKLFEFECDILARVIYIKLADRLDKAKIHFPVFARTFMGLLEEVKDKRNKTIFELLEFNGDGEYDLFFVFQLFINSHRETMFGQEMLKAIRLCAKMSTKKNVGGFAFNFSTYNSLIPYSCLIEEFQYKLFGVIVPPRNPATYTKEEKEMLAFKEEARKER